MRVGVRIKRLNISGKRVKKELEGVGRMGEGAKGYAMTQRA